MAAGTVPTLEIEDPSGRRVTIAPASSGDRLGDLAEALGLDPARPLHVDGRRVACHDTLARAGIRRGSRLAAAGPSATAVGAGVVVTVICEAGPSAGMATFLTPGRHVVGRAGSARVVVADPSVEPHHAALDVGADGGVEVVQLAGRVPCRVDGEPASGRAEVPDGGVVVVGASRLRVSRASGPAPGGASLAATPGDPWRRTLQRTPRLVPRWEPVPVDPPPAGSRTLRPSATGILAALLTTGGTVVVSVLMRSPMFLVFGGVALLAAIAMWAVGTIGAARDGRRWRATRDRDVADFATCVQRQREARWRHHLATTPGVAEAIAAATTLRGDVWSRRAGHDDAFRVAVGWGQVEWPVAVGSPDGPAPLAAGLAGLVAAAGRFDDALVAVDIGAGAGVALAGPGADAVARAIVVQVATWVGPADMRVVAIVDDPTAWEWCRWLPHAAGPGGSDVVAADDADAVAATFAATGDGTGRHVVVVTDRADLLAQRTAPLRRFLAGPGSAAVVAVVAHGGTPPAMCRSVLELGSIGVGRWWSDAWVDAHPVTVHAAGVTSAAAAAAARSLAGLDDPEVVVGGSGGFPATVGIGGLNERYGTGRIDDAIAVAAAWRSAGPDPAPVAILGAAADGVVEVDLVRDGPHGLIAGTTGSGKSELLRTLVVSLAARCSPDHLALVLVDYKGGSTFDACADLPHTVGVVTDLDDRLAERALLSLDAELRRRERRLRSVGAVDLAEWRSRDGAEPLPRLVVVIDEFATLAAELPGFLEALVGIAQRGRSLGVHLILATQRPTGVVSDAILANTNLRLALRLHDNADARDIVGDDGPVGFPRRTPGRTMLRLGPCEHVVFQAAHSSGPARAAGGERMRVVGGDDEPADGAETELAVLVRSIRNAAALCNVRPPHRPWLPPLPPYLGDDELPGQCVGLVDLPAEQAQRPLTWRAGDGNLVILGAVGAGTTTALRSVVLAACADRPPAGRHVYVVDARGDDRLEVLGGLDHCAGIVRLHERERLSRLLRRLAGEVDRRRAGGVGIERPHVVVAIDGLAALRASIDDPLRPADLDALNRILGEGANVGIEVVATAERPGAVAPSMLAAFGERWVMRLDDPGEASMCGIPPMLVPAGPPGRLVVASIRAEAQLADRVDLVDDVPTGPDGPAPIGVLAARIDGSSLPPSAFVGGELELVLGVEFSSLCAARLAVPDGEHAIVLGPARSGRTTALARVAVAWRAAQPGGPVLVVAPRRWPGADAPVELADALATVARSPGPVLLIVDDADRVDDPDGALGALIAERRPGVLVAAAGRPDALRPLYGHWTAVVRRSRIGVLLAACTDVDGDLLGELLPRHRPLPPRPGLAWLVDATGCRLAQLGM
jgi:DNA segregation ATPase FtsK/SpoIIIE, S-DNA-T family